VAGTKPQRPIGPWQQGPKQKLDGSQGLATGFRVKQGFERRPLRLGQVFDTSPFYFVTFCTHARRSCLAREEIHAAFVLFAERAERDFGSAVGRHVIMPNHVHLFVRGGPDFVLGRWVGMLKQSLGKASSLSRKNTQIWQEGFFDHVLCSNESYAQKWEYVRENPVRAGLVSRSEDWPYQGEIVYIDRV
jgi:putative transposase